MVVKTRGDFFAMSDQTATAITAATPWSRTNPFPARMLVNRRLSGPGSEKDTRHFELSLEDSGLSFEVGESVAVYPTNCPELVEEILQALGAKGDEMVPSHRGGETGFRTALLRDYSITQPAPKFVIRCWSHSTRFMGYVPGDFREVGGAGRQDT